MGLDFHSAVATAQPRPGSAQLFSCTGDSIAAEYRIRQSSHTKITNQQQFYLGNMQICSTAHTFILSSCPKNIFLFSFLPVVMSSTLCFDDVGRKSYPPHRISHECVMCQLNDGLEITDIQ